MKKLIDKILFKVLEKLMIYFDINQYTTYKLSLKTELEVFDDILGYVGKNIKLQQCTFKHSNLCIESELTYEEFLHIINNYNIKIDYSVDVSKITVLI
jgi:hypothetical protein